LRLRQQHRSVLLNYHAGKSGAQRGTSRREDLLDTVIALQHPSDYIASEGLRCEVRYEKARGFHGDEAKPFEVRMLREGEGAAKSIIAAVPTHTGKEVQDLGNAGKKARKA
jgi:putative DNA primase/helicase